MINYLYEIILASPGSENGGREVQKVITFWESSVQWYFQKIYVRSQNIPENITNIDKF